MKNKIFRHDCPALGKNTIVPRAFNTAYPDEIFHKCPMCGYMPEEEIAS